MNLWLALQDPNTQWVLAGCILLGISSGVLGCFAFLRGRSLMGDALAHAALPGVCLVYLLTGSKSIGLDCWPLTASRPSPAIRGSRKIPRSR
jgi:manganese/zinc/iron transport system permease protein